MSRFFRKEYETWRSNVPYGRTRVNLVMISDQDEAIYFTIDDVFAFKLSFRGRNLLRSFVSDYGAGCDNQKFCYWVQEMKKFVASSENIGMSSILTKAATLYDLLKTPTQDIQKIIDQTDLVERTNTSLNPMIADVAKQFTTRGCRIESYEKKTLKVIVPSHPSTVFISIQFDYDYPSMLPEIRIITPRFKLGGNISFGGTFQVDGLTPLSWRGGKNLVSLILKALSDAVFDDLHLRANSALQEYTERESKACKLKASKRRKTDGFSNITCFESYEISESSWIILPYEFIENIVEKTKRKIITIEVITQLGLRGYYSPKFQDVKVMKMSQLHMINLNIYDGDTVSFRVVEIPEARNLVLRPRTQDIYEIGDHLGINFLNSLGKHLESHRVISVGHTIDIKTEYKKYYIDVIELNNINLEEAFAVTLTYSMDYDIELLPALDSERLDPLSIPFNEEDYTYEETSEETTTDEGQALDDY